MTGCKERDDAKEFLRKPAAAFAKESSFSPDHPQLDSRTQEVREKRGMRRKSVVGRARQPME